MRHEADGRGQVAVLTAEGLRRLQRAWPTHLEGVRMHVMDHLAGLDLAALTAAMGAIGDAQLGPPVRRAPQPAD